MKCIVVGYTAYGDLNFNCMVNSLKDWTNKKIHIFFQFEIRSAIQKTWRQFTLKINSEAKD